MTTYFDTGVLAKRYIWEHNSHEAIAMIDAAGCPILFSHLHAIELPNAIRLKRFRKEITGRQESAAIRIFLEDIDTGRLQRPDYELSAVFIRATALSAKHSAKLGTRSLDILHVATALQAGCEHFSTLDTRQRKLAASEGMRVNP